jgi:hypothetical protein
LLAYGIVLLACSSVLLLLLLVFFCRNMSKWAVVHYQEKLNYQDMAIAIHTANHPLLACLPVAVKAGGS